MNDERLRQILLAGDPAAGGDAGLTPDEIHAMRRAMLTAAPEPRRRLLPWLALAGGAVAAILLAIVLSRPQPAPPPPRVAAIPVAPPPPVVRAPAERTPEPQRQVAERRTVPVHHRHFRHRSRPFEAPEPPAVQDTLASLAAAEPERQIQFSAPGGTRILWILKSGKTSR